MPQVRHEAGREEVKFSGRCKGPEETVTSTEECMLFEEHDEVEVKAEEHAHCPETGCGD
jgi:hypothetical protein